MTSFIEKVEIIAALKGHTEENEAMFIASKLTGQAFDVHRRLSVDDKKDPSKIKEQLRKEYCREERNREEALYVLLNSTRLPGESCQKFSYRILNLANLANAGIAENTRKTIAKDYYVNGLSRELQVAWNSSHNYSTLDLKQLSDETTRLELAGINAVKMMEIKAVDTPDASEIVTKIIEKVLEQISSSKASNTESDEVNAVRGGFNNSNINYRGNRGRDRSGYRDSRYNARNTPQTQDGKRCRAGQSPSHFFRNCPVRHCEGS